jgi:hypothetical protein
MKILALDQTGWPNKWISVEKAMFYHAKNLVAWHVGDPVEIFRGGKNKQGVQSVLETPSIIAIKNRSFVKPPAIEKVILTNEALFRRDRNICCYCGDEYPTAALSRDHVTSRFAGGLDTWTNVVTSCKNCNGIKGHKTLKELGWKMAYVPYEPNYFEAMILKNRNILADQMEFLLARVPQHSRLHLN